MQINEAKAVIVKHLNKLITEWFGDKPLIQALAKTILQANLNKYDNILEMISNEKGDIMFEELIENLDIRDGYQIDLTSISPLLPNRILIISKEDIQQLLDDLQLQKT